MASKTIITVTSLLILGCAAQRSPYAGRRPVGYPVFDTPSSTTTTTTTTQNRLGDRFGEDDVTTQRPSSTTTRRLPIEALGDRDLVDRLLRLPVDKQPFWLINWKAIEAKRGKPETYPQKANPFIDSTFTRNSISRNLFFRRR